MRLTKKWRTVEVFKRYFSRNQHHSSWAKRPSSRILRATKLLPALVDMEYSEITKPNGSRAINFKTSNFPQSLSKLMKRPGKLFFSSATKVTKLSVTTWKSASVFIKPLTLVLLSG